MPFQVGDEVAVLPHDLAYASTALEIRKVVFAGLTFVQLDDGSIYAVIGNVRLLSNQKTTIVTATDDHREAVKARGDSSELTFITSRAVVRDEITYTISLYERGGTFFAFWQCPTCGNHHALPAVGD